MSGNLRYHAVKKSNLGFTGVISLMIVLGRTVLCCAMYSELMYCDIQYSVVSFRVV